MLVLTGAVVNLTTRRGKHVYALRAEAHNQGVGIIERLGITAGAFAPRLARVSSATGNKIAPAKSREHIDSLPRRWRLGFGILVTEV
jgi:hypothetical protein